MSKIVNSRTAVLEIGDDVVKKVLMVEGWFEKDLVSLKIFESILGDGVLYDGWSYKCCRLIDFDEELKAIFMTRARGVAISESLDYASVHHAAVWISIFQFRNCQRNSNKKVPLFGDYGPPHVFVDSGNKEVIVIDPSLTIGEKVVPERDVGYMLSCLVLLSIKKLKNPIKVGRVFIESYFGCSNYKLLRPELLAVVKSEQEQTRRRWIRKARGRYKALGYSSLGVIYSLVNSLIINLIISKNKYVEH